MVTTTESSLVPERQRVSISMWARKIVLVDVGVTVSSDLGVGVGVGTGKYSIAYQYNIDRTRPITANE